MSRGLSISIVPTAALGVAACFTLEGLNSADADGGADAREGGGASSSSSAGSGVAAVDAGTAQDGSAAVTHGVKCGTAAGPCAARPLAASTSDSPCAT